METQKKPPYNYKIALQKIIYQKAG